jgi:hypothetical protein
MLWVVGAESATGTARSETAAIVIRFFIFDPLRSVVRCRDYSIKRGGREY